MLSRYSFVLLSIAAIVFACGPHPRSSSDAAASQPTRASTKKGTAKLEPALEVKVDGDVSFDFAVINNSSKKVEITFPSGHTHDIVVVDSLGREHWRWSDGRMFTQGIQNKPLSARDSVTWTGRWTEPSLRGKYTAVATLRSENYPLETRVDFVLP